MSGFKISTLLSSQRGFSLTEIMVGGGILAGVALASAQMFKDQKGAQRKVDNEQKLTIYHQGLAKNLTNSANCNATMQAFSNGVIPQNYSFIQLSKCRSNCEEKEGVQDHRAENVVAEKLIASDEFIDKTEVWKIKDVRTKSGRSTTGPVILKVDYVMNPKLTGGIEKTVVSKDIVLNARFSGGQFQECTNSQESNINNLQSDFCKSLNYENNGIATDGSLANSGKLATWNEKNQTCEMGVDKDCSGPGLMVDGIDSNGRVKCRSITTTNAAETMKSNNSSGACPTGTKPNVKFRSDSKRFEVQCE